MTTTRRFGNVRKLPSGRYQARWQGTDGKDRTAPTTFKTTTSARAWLSGQETDRHRGAYVDPDAGAITLGNYSDEWLNQRHDLAERTVELYRYLLDRHIVPTFGPTALAGITPSSVRSWHARIAKNHPTTAAKAYRLLSTIMRTAVADRHLLANPCQVKGAAAEKAPERPVATIAEVQALAEAMPDRLAVAVLLAAWCQLRRGELLGLRRRDVDTERGTVTVAVTRTKTMSGEMVEKVPKTEAGRRTLAVPSNVLAALTHHLDTYVAPEPDALVLDGGYRPLRTGWDNARAKVGRPDLHIHDLRHSGLTWSAATGATVAELMRRAGHKSPVAAMTYQHATEDRDRVLADALAALAT
jgi:integrase